MSKLDDDIRAADAIGLSYGYYIAQTYPPGAPIAPIKEKKRNHQQRRFTDAQAFTLWQQGMTDAEIGKAVNVSRALIQRWRDQLELPSTSKSQIDTKKYRLAALQDGTTIVICENDLI